MRDQADRHRYIQGPERHDSRRYHQALIEVGSVLGQNRLTGKLGAGGMGEVWSATNVHLPGMVRAVKVIRPEIAADPEFRARFLREAQLLEALHHPNIVRIHDTGERDGALYLSMELLQGTSLEQMTREGPIAGDLLVDITRQAFSGLAHAHARGVVHRDLKPANLFRLVNGQIKILDFGIAKSDIASLTLTGVERLIGSPAYFAPEFADGDSATAASDVYAMGVTLFQLATGRLPFTAGEGTQMQVSISLLVQHATRPFPDVRKVRSDVPESIERVIQLATAKSAGSRPTAEALAAMLAGRTDLQTEEVTLAPIAAPSSRLRVYWAFFVPVMVVIAGLLFATRGSPPPVQGGSMVQLAQLDGSPILALPVLPLRRAPAKPMTKATAYFRATSFPTAEVFLDSTAKANLIGVTPMLDAVKVASGKHVLILRGEGCKEDLRTAIDLQANEVSTPPIFQLPGCDE